MDEKMNILLVDDQPAKLLTYEAVLSDLNENLIKATSGMEALEKLLKYDVALVLMDVNMPGMDGFETAEMIHQHPRFENTPIVFVSGIHISDIDRLRGYRHGAVDYIPVPVSPELLRAKVKVFADLHRKTRQLELLNERMTLVQEEERRRIARELHDSVGQLLVAISMNHAVLASESHKLSPEAAKGLTENAAMVEEVSKQIRTISYLLHPPLLDEAGIKSALHCYVEGFSKRSKIDVRLEIASDVGRLPSEMEITIFRLVQESLTNVHRHSGSRDAAIRITRNEVSLTVEIEDSGKGMILDGNSPAQPGVGLQGMHERLRSLGGALQIYSSDRGTKLKAVIPLVRTGSLLEAQVPAAESVLKVRSM
jgi:signal transduction histidine kinase